MADKTTDAAPRAVAVPVPVVLEPGAVLAPRWVVGRVRLGDWTALLTGSPRTGAAVLLAGVVLAVSVAAMPGRVTGVVASGAATTVAWMLLAAVLPLLSYIDLRARRLPTRILYATGTLAGALLAWDVVAGDLPLAALGRAVGAGTALAVIYLAVLLVARVGSFGMGDVRFAGVAGFVLGTHSWVLAFSALLLVPPLAGIGPGLIHAARARSTSVSVPFGPFMAVGVLIAMTVPTVLVDLVVR
ncbi:prepilin peptidase [Nocardioides pakistanensis]